MSFTRWLSDHLGLPSRAPGRASRRSAKTKAAAPRRTFRPCLECLEDRWVPSTLAVTNSADLGTQHGTLRWAVAHAQSGDTILLTQAVKSGITLTQGELVLARDVTIEAKGKTPVTISGGGISRIFEVAAGAHVTLSNLSITGGNGLADNPAGNASKDYSGGGILVDAGAVLTVNGSTLSDNFGVIPGGGISYLAAGGGISNYGTLTFSGSTLSGSYASSGGGISNYGTLMVSASSLSDNHAYLGGGIYNSRVATMTVSGGILSGNFATFGGGIYNVGTVTVDSGSTLSGNYASSRGGGIYNTSQFGPGTVTVSGSTLSGNSAGRDGGGIYNYGYLTVSDASAISGNSAGYFGGGIYNPGGLVTVSDSTLSNNSARSGGGIYSFGEVTVSASTISGNTASGGGIYDGGGGIFNSGTLTVENESHICGNFAPVGFGADVNNLGDLYLDSSSTICILDGSPAFPI